VSAPRDRCQRILITVYHSVQAAIDARLDVVEGHRFDYSLSRAFSVELFAELIQTEDKFTDTRDALKALNKMDLDKLIAAVTSTSLAA
jgi:DNA mismatch repair protein MSH4